MKISGKVVEIINGKLIAITGSYKLGDLVAIIDTNGLQIYDNENKEILGSLETYKFIARVIEVKEKFSLITRSDSFTKVNIQTSLPISKDAFNVSSSREGEYRANLITKNAIHLGDKVIKLL